MRALPTTMGALWRLAVATNRKELPILWLYYAECGEDAPTQAIIHKETGLALKDIKAGTDGLEKVGLVRVTRLPSNRRLVRAINVFSSLDVDVSSSYILQEYSKRYKKKEENRPVYVQTGKLKTDTRVGFGVEDIKSDEDWKKAEAILLKYFKPYSINPVFLTKKNFFMKLLELMDSVDFDAYCKWYRVEKYPVKKFHYGLFLYPGMINEFEDAMEDSDSYLRTSTNMEGDESYQRLLEEQDKVLEVEFGGEHEKKAT